MTQLSIQQIRAEAARCLRLSQSITDERTIRILEARALELIDLDRDGTGSLDDAAIAALRRRAPLQVHT